MIEKRGDKNILDQDMCVYMLSRRSSPSPKTELNQEPRAWELRGFSVQRQALGASIAIARLGTDRTRELVWRDWEKLRCYPYKIDALEERTGCFRH